MIGGTPRFPIRQMTREDTLAGELEEQAEREAREADEPLRLSEKEARAVQDFILNALDNTDDKMVGLSLASALQKLEDWLNAQ